MSSSHTNILGVIFIFCAIHQWFELWRYHIETAVERRQKLCVFFFAGHRGKGKAASWAGCREDARRRDAFWLRKNRFLESLRGVSPLGWSPFGFSKEERLPIARWNSSNSLPS